MDIPSSRVALNQMLRYDTAMADSRRTERPAFIVTKPLQLIVSMALRDQLRLQGEARLYIVASFASAADITERLRSMPAGWSDVHLVTTRSEAIRKATRVSATVFIDSDVGLRTWLAFVMGRCLNGAVEAMVYEEGIGTYSETQIVRPLKRLIYHFFGIGWTFGASSFTKVVFVERPDLLPRAVKGSQSKVVSLERSISDEILDRRGFFRALFWPEESLAIPDSLTCKEQCNVYLSAWRISESVIGLILSNPGIHILKPHPHDKIESAYAQRLGFSTIIPARVPAELLILRLTEVCAKVLVFHHGTSAQNYIRHENVEFRLLPN